MTFILPSFGASAISAVPGGGGGGFSNTYSLDLDGTNDYLDPGTNFQSTFQSDFTISTWFKEEASTSGVRAFYGIRGSSSMLSYHTGTQISVWIKYNGARTIATFNQTRDSDWHHLAVKLNQNGSSIEIRAYVDGVLKIFDNSNTNAMSSWSSTGNMFIGARNYDSDPPDIFFQGKIDEFAIFGSALSDGGVSTGQTAGGDIATLYNSGVPDDLSSLSPVAWYRMGDDDSGTGTTVTDQGSGGNDGTLTNGPTFSTNVP